MLDLVLHHRRPDALDQAVGEGEDRKACKHSAAIPEKPAGHRPAQRHIPEIRPREELAAGGNKDRNPEHCRGTTDQIEQTEGSEAAESRAEQVDPIDHADGEGAAGQGQADDDAGEEERERQGNGELSPDDE